ncbi:MAG: ABC transporter substrate-binding protein, partial [candidate division KSB1 bacterium]|nr:ABC transporter substrate-binding protein [candidate division KSB1 bacterium]
MWNGILSIVKVVLALSLLLSLPACDGKKETVKIGLANMPNSINGARLAVEEINTAGGIYQKPLELVIDSMKTSSTPQEAIATAMEFSSRKDILAFIGYTTSSLSLAASQVFNEKGLVQLIPNATSPALSNAGPWTFRVCVNDKLQGAFIADFVVDKLHKQRLAIFYVNDDYGRALKENFVARLQSRKGKVVLEVPYLEGKSFDFESSLPNVQSKNPEMIFFAGRAPRLL